MKKSFFIALTTLFCITSCEKDEPQQDNAKEITINFSSQGVINSYTTYTINNVNCRIVKTTDDDGGAGYLWETTWTGGNPIFLAQGRIEFDVSKIENIKKITFIGADNGAVTRYNLYDKNGMRLTGGKLLNEDNWELGFSTDVDVSSLSTKIHTISFSSFEGRFEEMILWK